MSGSPRAEARRKVPHTRGGKVHDVPRRRQPVASDAAKLERRVAAAAEAALAARGFVTPIDVVVGIGWLDPAQVEQWRRARIGYLERIVTVNLRKLSTAPLGNRPRPDSQRDHLRRLDPRPAPAAFHRNR